MRVEGVGDIVAKRLINHLGSAQAVFAAKKAQILARWDGEWFITILKIYSF